MAATQETPETRSLTVRDVARRLNVSKPHVYRLASEGVLPAFRVGRAVRVDADELAAWLREQKR
jgi:putative molybdopterin biosynthesis protein